MRAVTRRRKRPPSSTDRMEELEYRAQLLLDDLGRVYPIVGMAWRSAINLQLVLSGERPLCEHGYQFDCERCDARTSDDG